jgi:hypothetical protein
LEDSFPVGLFVLEDDLYPLQGHYQRFQRGRISRLFQPYGKGPLGRYESPLL